MGQFSQKPAHIKHKGEVSLFEAFAKARREKSIKSQLKPRKSKSFASIDTAERKKSSGFSFPVPSFATLAVIAGVVVIALAAFKF